MMRTEVELRRNSMRSKLCKGWSKRKEEEHDIKKYAERRTGREKGWRQSARGCCTNSEGLGTEDEK